MRTLLLVLALASAAHAQDPVPDPTPPHRYFPLAVGDEWEYLNFLLDADPSIGRYTRREIVRDTIVGGVRYFAEVTTQRDSDQEGWDRSETRFLRYDSTTTRVVQLVTGHSDAPIECPFGVDFGEVFTCWGESSGTALDGDMMATGRLDATVRVDPSVDPTRQLRVEAVKAFTWVEPVDPATTPVYAAPIGYVGEEPGMCGCFRSLTYARVLQDDGTIYEVGARYGVASEAAPEAARLGLAVGPNPTAGPLALALDVPVPGAVTVEAFDALGRRVWHQTVALGTGRQRLDVDARAWAPGLYVVRATAGDATASASVVRR